MKLFRLLLSHLIILSLCTAGAQTAPAPSSGADVYSSRISEYFFSRSGREVLKPIRLLGNVTKPGVYHIPTEVDLTTLLSISGGTDKEAEPTSILISRKSGEKLTVNLFDTIKSGQEVKLMDGDLVYIPRKEPTFDQNTMNAVTIITSLVTLLLTSYVVVKNNK